MQVELDKLNWERDRLVDEIELFKAQVQEQQHLKSIVENNLEESIKSLTHEREVSRLIALQSWCESFGWQVWGIVVSCAAVGQFREIVWDKKYITWLIIHEIWDTNS